MSESKRITETLYRWRVRGGLLGLILSVILARPNFYSLLSGMGFCILGLLLRGWACGHLQKEKKLAVTGPYGYTRNPLYLGNLLIALGVVAAARSWWVAAIFALNFLVFYPIAIRQEKRRMLELFPSEYAEYSRHVPLFIPGIKPFAPAEPKSFSWDLYHRNKEKRAWHAALVFWGIMFLKVIVFF